MTGMSVSFGNTCVSVLLRCLLAFILLGLAAGVGVYQYKKRRGRGEIVPDDPDGNDAEMDNMNQTATVHGTY